MNIIHPVTGEIHNVLSAEGNEILKSYVFSLKYGGMEGVELTDSDVTCYYCRSKRGVLESHKADECKYRLRDKLAEIEALKSENYRLNAIIRGVPANVPNNMLVGEFNRRGLIILLPEDALISELQSRGNYTVVSTDLPPAWTPAGVTPGAAAPPIPPPVEVLEDDLPPAWTPPETDAATAPVLPPLPPVLQGRTTSTETVPETPQGAEPE